MSHVGRDAGNRRQGIASDARQSGPEREGKAVDAAGGDAERFGRRATLHGRADLEPDGCEVHQEIDEEHAQRAETQNEAAGVLDAEVRQHLKAADQPRWAVDADIVAVADTGRLNQNQAHAPRRQQSFERPAVQVPHHDQLDQPADGGRCKKGNRKGGNEVPVGRMIGRMTERPLHFVGRISPDHHQFAVGHVDDAHLAINDRQAERHQDQHGAQRQAVGQVAAPADPVLVPFDRVNCFLVNGQLAGRNGSLIDLLLEVLRGRQTVELAQLGDRSQTLIGGLVSHVASDADDQRAFSRGAADAAVAVGLGDFLERFQKGRVAALTQAAGGGGTFFGVARRVVLQEANHVLQELTFRPGRPQVAQVVRVDDQRLPLRIGERQATQRIEQRGRLLATGRLDLFAEHDLLSERVQVPFLKRLQQPGDPRVSRFGQVLDGVLAVVGVFVGQPLDLLANFFVLSGDPGGAGAERQQNGDGQRGADAPPMASVSTRHKRPSCVGSRTQARNSGESLQTQSQWQRGRHRIAAPKSSRILAQSIGGAFGKRNHSARGLEESLKTGGLSA